MSEYSQAFYPPFELLGSLNYNIYLVFSLV